MNPTFFATPADLRAWFDANHATVDVLWIGFYRKGTGTTKANRTAWATWQARTPSYRKTHTWWVVSAKKEETRQRRLVRLIASLIAEDP